MSHGNLESPGTSLFRNAVPSGRFFSFIVTGQMATLMAATLLFQGREGHNEPFGLQGAVTTVHRPLESSGLRLDPTRLPTGNLIGQDLIFLTEGPDGRERTVTVCVSWQDSLRVSVDGQTYEVESGDSALRCIIDRIIGASRCLAERGKKKIPKATLTDEYKRVIATSSIAVASSDIGEFARLFESIFRAQEKGKIGQIRCPFTFDCESQVPFLPFPKRDKPWRTELVFTPTAPHHNSIDQY